MFIDEAQTGTANTVVVERGGWSQSLIVLRSRLALAAQRWSTRRHLAALDDDQLADIGVTRRQALREVRRSFPFFGP